MPIKPKLIDGSVNPLVQGVIRSLSEALELTVAARRLHAFSVRAPSMIELYYGLWLEKTGPTFNNLDVKSKELTARWFEHIEIVKSAGDEISQGEFSGVRRNSIVVLADIIENVFESFLHICLEYHLPDGYTSYDFTGVRRPPKSYRDYRNDVRKWEKSLQETSRMRRLCSMVRAFFPSYAFPEEKVQVLDDLIRSRNVLTHELIDIRSHERVMPTEEDTQNFFDEVGESIMSLIKIFIGDIERSTPKL